MNRTLLVMLAFALSGCGFAAGQLKDKADEERLLKPGALDVPISSRYRTYHYKFLGKYQITHDWVFAGSCQYGSVEDRSTGKTLYTGNVFEIGRHVYVDRESPSYPIDSRYPKGTQNLNLDRYVRPEWQSTDGKGNVRTNKGFTPMCFESWGGTSHVLAMKLYKKDVSTWKNELEKINPAGKFKEEIIGKNTWLVQHNEIAERRVNTVGGAYLHYTTPIGNTGYTLTIQLGANQDSLKHPEAHARMQEIFRHLVESVKIEAIDTNAK